MRVRKIVEADVPDLGSRIKAAREACPRSLESICAEVGLSRTYWYELEKDAIKGTLSVENLSKIETALGVDFGVNLE